MLLPLGGCNFPSRGSITCKEADWKCGGKYSTDFEQKFSHDVEKVKSWRAAVTEVGNLAGYHLQDHG